MSDGSVRNEKFEEVRRAEQTAAAERAEQSRLAASQRSRGQKVMDKLRRRDPAPAPTPVVAPAAAPAATVTREPEPDLAPEPTADEPSRAEKTDDVAEAPQETPREAVRDTGDSAAPAPTDRTDRADRREERRAAKAERSEQRASSAASFKDTIDGVRSRIATVVWLVAVVCALFLAVGALLVALKANEANSLVDFVRSGAHNLDLGVFSPENGLFTPKKDPQLVKASLINWGLGAIAYLVVGKILDRVIRP